MRHHRPAAASPAAASSRETASEENALNDALVAFMRSANDAPEGVSPKLTVARDVRNGRCLRTNAPIGKGEKIVLCPRSLVITEEDAARISPLARKTKSDNRPAWHVLSAFILDAPDSFKPYIDTLPKKTNNVCEWNREGLDKWVKRASPATYQLADSLWRDTQEAANFLSSLEGAPDKERCKWALSTTLSRMARLTGMPPDSEGLAPLALVPYADCLNHDASLPSGDRDGRRVTLSSRLPSQARGVLQTILKPNRDAAAVELGHLHFDEGENAVVVKAASFEPTSLEFWNTSGIDPRVQNATGKVLEVLFNRRKSALGELEQPSLERASGDDGDGTYKAGDEVFVSYGTRASGDLLTTYGFAPTHESNAFGARAGLFVDGELFTFDINPRGDVAEIPVGFLEACDTVATEINAARRANPPPEGPLAPAVGLDVARALIEDVVEEALRGEVDLEAALESEEGITAIAGEFGIANEEEAQFLVEDLRRVFESESRVWQRAQTALAIYSRSMASKK